MWTILDPIKMFCSYSSDAATRLISAHHLRQFCEDVDIQWKTICQTDLWLRKGIRSTFAKVARMLNCQGVAGCMSTKVCYSAHSRLWWTEAESWPLKNKKKRTGTQHLLSLTCLHVRSALMTLLISRKMKDVRVISAQECNCTLKTAFRWLRKHQVTLTAKD